MSAIALKHLENCFNQPVSSRNEQQSRRFGCELTEEDIVSLRGSAAAAWLLPYRPQV